MRFADPKNDLAFKKIFGNESRKEILISFLNATLDFHGGQTIVDVQIVNPYQLPQIPELKETILDIKATNQAGQVFIVEMQKKNLGEFTKRSLYYTSKAYVAQLDASKNYAELKKVYFIGILDFNFFDDEQCISRHLIINQETQQQDLKDFEFAFIELKKFNKQLGELNTVFDQWIYFIKNAANLDIVPDRFADSPAISMAFQAALQTSWNKKELEIYDYMELKAYDEIHALDTARLHGLKEGMEKGMEIGIEQGIEKGMEKGIEIGIEQGIEQGRLSAKLAIAANLLAALIQPEKVAEITGVSQAEIQKLVQKQTPSH